MSTRMQNFLSSEMKMEISGTGFGSLPKKLTQNSYFKFEHFPEFTKQSKNLFYPLHWTRVCLSKDSNTSLGRLFVDGELLIEQEVKVKNQPDNLNLDLGWSGTRYKFPGKTTDLNIFASALTVEEMKLQISPGVEACGF